MTVTTTANSIQYAGNGVTTAFAFPYIFFEPSDLVVTLFNDAANSPVVPAPVLNGAATYDYTVTGVITDGEYASGGTVSFNTAPITGYTVALVRAVPATQEVTLIDNTKFPAATVNTEFDKLTVLVQQAYGQDLLALHIPAAEIGLTVEAQPITVRRSRVLAWDPSGNLTQSTKTLDEIENIGATPIPPGIFNVKAYGAVGDGVADDTAAIQATITAATAYAAGLGAGATVYMGIGVFLTTSTVTVSHDGIFIKGEGPTSTFWVNETANSDTLVFSNGGGPLAYLQFVGVSGIRFYCHLVDPGTSGAHVRFVNCGSILVDACAIEQKFDNLVFEGGLGGNVSNTTCVTGNWWTSRKVGSSAARFKAFSTQPCTGLFLTNFNAQSNGTNTFMDDAIIIESADGLQFSNYHAGFAGQAAVRIRPSAGTGNTTGIVFSNGYIDGYFGATGIDGVVIENPNGNTGLFGMVRITDSFILGTYSGNGLRVASNATAFHGLSVVGGFHGSGVTGDAIFHISSGFSYLISGGRFFNGPPAQPAILIDGDAIQATITGNAFDNDGGFTMSPAVKIAGTANFNFVNGNNFGVITGITNTSTAGQNEFGVNLPDTWTSYTPTITSQTGTITTASAAGRYKKTGRTVSFEVSITITTNGTGGGSVLCMLPAQSISGQNFAGVGKEAAVTGLGLVTYINSGFSTTQMIISQSDSLYPGGNGRLLIVSIAYEAA